MATNTIAWIVYLIPFLGSFVMIYEAGRGKEITGTILIGTQKIMHLIFGIISLILDFLLVGVGGSISRGIFKFLGKGFLKGGAERIGLASVARGIGKVEKSRLGRMVVRGAERKIRKGAEHTLGKVHGYRVDKDKRREMQSEYGTKDRAREDGLSEREQIIADQKMIKRYRKQNANVQPQT